jgi:hypothetical protein
VTWGNEIAPPQMALPPEDGHMALPRKVIASVSAAAVDDAPAPPF